MIEQLDAILLAAGVTGGASTVCTVAVLKAQLRTHIGYLAGGIDDVRKSASRAHRRIDNCQSNLSTTKGVQHG